MEKMTELNFIWPYALMSSWKLFDLGTDVNLSKWKELADVSIIWLKNGLARFLFYVWIFELNMGLWPRFLKSIINRFIFSDALQLVIVGNKRGRISLENLAEFPPFLRFNKVLLLYGAEPSSQPLLAKCILFEYCLNSIKPALKDSNKIHFVASINHADPSHFSDHSSLAIYLHNRLLPICDSSRRYMFDIVFDSQSADENSVAEVISSILQIPQARTCSNVSIALFYFYVSARLPVENISNWLAPETDDGIELYGKRKQNRFLLIFSSTVENTQEMWEHLKEVNFFHDLAHF